MNKNLISKELLLKAHRFILLSRKTDERELILLKQGKIFFHLSGPGHEAIQVASAMAMKPNYDWAYPYYRDLAFSLAYGSTPLEMFRENMNRVDGPSSHGRQMPSHYGNKNLRIVGQSSPTGTQYLQAVGTAMGAKKSGTDEIVYVSSGEGATSEGEFYEALNWATREKHPVLFVIQNNGYSISVPFKDQGAGVSIFDLTAGYKNLLRIEVDGTDFVKSFEATTKAVEYIRNGNGPAIIEASCVRLTPHSSSDDQKKYKPAEEIESDKKRDPILILEKYLIENNFATKSELEEIHQKIKLEVEADSAVAENSPHPDPASVEENVLSPNIIVKKENFSEVNHTGDKIVLVDAINHALHEEMERNKKMIVYGEDIADGKGGVFTATKGLSTKFGNERAFNSPIAEASIVGTAIGLSIYGFKPVVEIQFGDYIWPAFMQIRDELVMFRYRTDGEFSCPMVIRVPVGGYIRGGLYHSQNIEAFFAHMPGLWIAYPSNAADAKGLLKSAIREENPVLFCEHKGLYRQQFAASPEPDKDFVIPFGVANVKKVGVDVTVVTWGFLVQRSIEAAQKLEKDGVSVEVIDLRTIAPWDKETVFNSIKKTGKVLIAHEDTLTAGFGAEISASIMENCFQYLDAPVTRVAAKDTPIPFAPVLENAVLPQESDITFALKKLVMA